MKSMPGGHGSYRAIRAWELKLMIDLRMTEWEYGDIPKESRAKMIVAEHISEWQSTLENWKQYQELKKKNKK